MPFSLDYWLSHNGLPIGLQEVTFVLPIGQQEVTCCPSHWPIEGHMMCFPLAFRRSNDVLSKVISIGL